MTKVPSVEDKVVTEFFTKCRVHLRSDPHGRCAVEHALVQALTADRLALILEVRKVLAFEGVLSMSVEKALSEINPTH